MQHKSTISLTENKNTMPGEELAKKPGNWKAKY